MAQDPLFNPLFLGRCDNSGLADLLKDASARRPTADINFQRVSILSINDLPNRIYLESR